VSDVDFERRVERALRAPVPTNARAKAVIMDGVRRVARDGMARRSLTLPVGRTTRHSLIGLALAAGIGSITTLSTLVPGARGAGSHGSVTSRVIGDSVVDRLRDTMRLVRLMFDDPSARQVSVVGDFNGWHTETTLMRRDEHTGRWAVTLALHDGEHRYAIVVDNTRWAGDSSAQAADASGHVYSLLHVARATN
jgi:hypothetical protein